MYLNCLCQMAKISPADTQLDLKVGFKPFSLLILVCYMLPLENLADSTLTSLSIDCHNAHVQFFFQIFLKAKYLMI